MLRDKLFTPLVKKLGAILNTITIMYDEGNELTLIESDIMVFIYHSHDMNRANFFQIDAQILKDVFDARDADPAKLTPKQLQSINFFESFSKSLLDTVAVIKIPVSVTN